MEHIEKEGFTFDPETGNYYAKMRTPLKPRKKRRKYIQPSDSDIIFGLWIQKEQKKLRLQDIADATGWKPQTLIKHAYKMGWAEKVAQVLKATPAAGLSVERVATSLAERLMQGAEEHQTSIDELMQKTRSHFKKLKGGAILKAAKEIDTLDKIGRRTYGLDKEEQRAASAPLLNVQFLMGVGTGGQVNVSTATPAGADPAPLDSPAS